MERVLFYLPVVTPWWFDNIVAHLIRALSTASEVHVLVPPLWRNTGIAPEQLMSLAPLTDVNWHIADGAAHPSLRTSPEDPEELVDFVRSLDPGYIFCRSADIVTPSRFPGQVRYLTEAGAPPLSTQASWIILQPDFWHHGAMPELTDEDRAAIERMFAQTWDAMGGAAGLQTGQARVEALQSLGLPTDRKIIALPLEYEHEEAFTGFHNKFERNLDLIHHLAEQVDGDFVIAVSDHPLNRKHVDNSALHEAIAALGERMRLLTAPEGCGSPTDLLIRHCDGLIVQNTKAIYSGAFFGKPTLRLSHRPSAEWLAIHDDFESLKAAILSGKAGAAQADARLWFGFHALHEIIDPATVSGAEILDRVNHPFSRDRLAAGLDRLESDQRQLGVAA